MKCVLVFAVGCTGLTLAKPRDILPAAEPGCSGAMLSRFFDENGLGAETQAVRDYDRQGGLLGYPSEGTPGYPYMNCTCMKNRQRYVADLAKRSGCTTLIELGALYTRVAEFYGELGLDRDLVYVNVDPQATPDCGNAKHGATLFEADVPMTLAEFLRNAEVQRELRLPELDGVCVAAMGITSTLFTGDAEPAFVELLSRAKLFFTDGCTPSSVDSVEALVEAKTPLRKYEDVRLFSCTRELCDNACAVDRTGIRVFRPQPVGADEIGPTLATSKDDASVLVEGGARAGRREPRLLLGASGDLLVYEALHLEALARGSYRPLWSQLEPVIQQADVFYANLEGTVTDQVDGNGKQVNATLAFEYGDVYQSWKNNASDASGGPRGTAANSYNYHPQIVADIAESGIDVLSVANNHALDRGEQGLRDTIDNLQKGGVQASTRAAAVSAQGWTTSWVSCTQFVNLEGHGSRSIPANDTKKPDDYRPRNILAAQHLGIHDCEDDAFLAEIRNSAAVDDAVVAALHMDGGPQYAATDVAADAGLLRKQARAALEAGAALVLVTGSHVVRSGWEVYETQDGRQTVAMYSLGNVLSNVALGHPMLAAGEEAPVHLKASALWFSGLVNPGRAEVSCVSYVPVCWVPTQLKSTHATLVCNDAEQEYLREVLHPAHAASKAECTNIGKFA